MKTVKHINILDPSVANKIAAGEVVERPASVVKELVENSLDAGATAVTVEIREGGIDYIRVSDNGCGIPEEDVSKAFLRHATSKLDSAEGLDGIETLGFRGEALASISAVSHVEMRTRTEDAESGTLVRISGGSEPEILPCGCPTGTSIEIGELFFNVPARLKFLKTSRAEAAAVGDYITRLILGNTEVSFRFISNGKTVYHSAGNGSLMDALVCVYGSDCAEHIRPVEFDDGYMRIGGYCGDEYLSGNSRVRQSVFVNGRYVRSQQVSYAAQRAYNTRLMVGRFPFLILNIRLSPREVDVNVHPNKLTVKFRDEDRISAAVASAVRDALNRTVDQEISDIIEEQEPERVDSFVPSQTVHEQEHRKADPSELYSLFHNDRRSAIAEDPDGRSSCRKAENDVHLDTDYLLRDSASAGVSQTSAAEDVLSFDFRRKNDSDLIESEAIAFDVSPYTIIGTAFDTFIIVQQGDSIFYIDQHAAHERILYERLIKNELRFHSQLLLTKQIVSLTPTEFELLMSNIERFYELGFDIEEFGASSVSVQSVPFGVRANSVERLIRDMIAVLEKQGSVQEIDLMRSSLIQASCKHAIKAGQQLDNAQIAELLSYYAREDAPLTCPHGRPVMLRVTKRELEKMFKRIV